VLEVLDLALQSTKILFDHLERAEDPPEDLPMRARCRLGKG
jgi:hypothetical protein